ncbi:putative amidoligase domain-containing protein [Paenibacillus dakarensis]|uniref:putative amidoligase domain-containing protein n=1 Tax=Paenibacillus dakarensis TaxID=1527293 RepID=UPI000A6AF4AC|nr:hypothetical protein [Paenibacillus dakarensis]
MARVLDDLTNYSFKGTRSPQIMDARLKRSGVPSRILQIQNEDAVRRYTARYQVKVDGLDSAKVTQFLRGGIKANWSEEKAQEGVLEDGLRKRLVKAAIRALYALGTDAGEVEIAVLPGRRYAVDKIKVRYNVQDRNRAEQHGEPPFSGTGLESDILMGMDPEFILVSKQGHIIPASLYLERGGAAGSDAVREGDEVSYPLGELRPMPQPDPDRLLVSMRQTLREAQQLITDDTLQWKAGGLPDPRYPLGGHLHFSGVPLTMSVLQCLDNYLALPLAILEDPAGRGRRPRYGFLGDYRRQPYGGFEYRTLPSFLVSPLITKASLYIAYLIIMHHSKLRARPLNHERYHKAYYEGNPAVLREAALKLHQDLTLLPEYGTYSRVIDQLFEYIREGRTWDESRDIRPLWNIPAMP